MRRRDLIKSIICAATAWPLTAHAQQSMPVIGFLSGSSLKSVSNEIAAFQDGLKEAGFVEDRNVRLEYRWAEQHYDRLPALANELVALRVAVIAATGGTASILAAKAATSTIPIVFVTGGDPVQQRIVASLNQPGGNATGVSWLGNMLQSKQFETLHELVPNAALFAALVNPDNPNFETDLRSLYTAADTLGQKLLVVKAKGENDIAVGFENIVEQKAGRMPKRHIFATGFCARAGGPRVKSFQYPLMTQSGHGGGPLGCNERHNSRSKNVISSSCPM